MSILFYGWNTTKFRSDRPKDIKCFHCHQVGQMIVDRYASTCHIFFIPLFPYRVRTEAECVSCKTAFRFKDLPPALKDEYRTYSSFKSPPFWHFSGILIGLAFMVWGWAADISKNKETESRIGELAKGRIIEIEVEGNEYSTLKVCRVEGEFVHAVPNLYQVSSLSHIAKIQSPENYGNDTMLLAKTLLYEWLEEGKIKDIYWGTYKDMGK